MMGRRRLRLRREDEQPTVYRPGEEIEFVIKVRVTGSRLLYMPLKDQIMKAVDAFSNLQFVSIRENIVPDRFTLENPDDPPEDFK